MRGKIITPAILLLAACQPPAMPEGKAEDAPGNVLTTPDSSSGSAIGNNAAPPPAPAAEAPATQEALPAEFHGRYDESRVACRGSSEYRLVITASELRYHESVGRVRKVVVEEPLVASVTADYQGEGETWSNVRELRLSKDGSSIMITGDGTGLTRIRCQ